MSNQPVHRKCSALVVAGFAALLVSGCGSSKNPDALTGMDVDENLAMMNAETNSGANAVATDLPKPSPGSANVSSADAADLAPTARATAEHREPSNEVSAPGVDATNSPVGDDQSGANQAGEDDETPNATDPKVSLSGDTGPHFFRYR
jgi:hypothetical protein